MFYLFFVYRIVSCIKKSEKFNSLLLVITIYTVTAVLTLYSCHLFYICYSRAATISLIIIIIIISIDYFLHALSKLHAYVLSVCHVKEPSRLLGLEQAARRRFYKLNIRHTLSVIILIAIISLTLFLYLKQDKTLDTYTQIKQTTYSTFSELYTILYEDVRIPLWQGCMNLISDHPLTGTGIKGFESTFSTYKPIDYFLRHHSSTITKHPHSTLLFVAATMGIPALFFWCILWIYPLIYCLIQFKRLSLFMKVVVLSYFSLFIGGLVDLTLFQWPTLYIAAILIGLMWKEVWGTRSKGQRVRSKEVGGQWSVVGKREGQRAEGSEKGEAGGQCSVVGKKEGQRGEGGEERVKSKEEKSVVGGQRSVGACPISNQLTVNSEQEIENRSKGTAPCRDTRCVSKGSISGTKNIKTHVSKSAACSPKPVAFIPFYKKYSLTIKIFVYTIAVLVLILTVINIYNTFCSTFYFAFGEGSEKVNSQEGALYYYKKGLSYKKDPKYLYKAGMILTNSFDNPQEAYYFFNILNEISPNFAHSNAYTALNLIKLNKKKDAIPYLTKEVINYPLSATAWFRLSIVQRELKMYKDADFSLKNAQIAISYKGLPPNAMKFLIDNPKYDFQPWHIPKATIDRLKQEYKKEIIERSNLKEHTEI